MKSSSPTGTSYLGQSTSKTLLASERIQSHATSKSNSPSKLGVNRQLRHRTRHTHAEIWKWTLTQHAIAPCRVEDIYAMQACDSEPGCDPDYYWLGYVPCRCILLYGMVVGVQVYEQRVVYTVDDGSGKIDCNLREARTGLNKTTTSTSRSSALMVLPTTPVPIASVGDIVRAVGRVLERRESKLINLDSLTVCHNATEEPLHWFAVMNLHATWYDEPSTSPFVIPPPPAHAPISSRRASISTSETEESRDPYDRRAMPPPSKPVSPSKLSVASSAPSSPSSVASSSLSGSSHHGPMSPPRLRHPSRLHTRDLTANTFRLYVKHYMDNAPSSVPSGRPKGSLGLVSDSSENESEEDVWGGREEPATPSKSRHSQNKRGQYEVDLTPRPRKGGRIDVTPRVSRTAKDNEKDGIGLTGYTLSHLRRVPELALLARRVVEAEHKRRVKEQRKKMKEDQQTSSTTKTHRPVPTTSRPSGSTPTTARSTSIALGKGIEGEPVSAKMKRLFRYAIRQLYDDGSIVMWDGPVRPPPRPAKRIPRLSFSSDTQEDPEIGTSWGRSSPEGYSRLWKSNTSRSTAGDTTRSTALSNMSHFAIEDDIEYLSDPPPAEESYIPLTSPYLAKVIEQAIVEIISRCRQRNSRSYSSVKKGPPPPGPTVDEIVKYLHRKDARWERVGEWAVKEALEWGNEQGRVWCVGDGRWEVCG